MPEDVDFQISGCVRARRLRAKKPPRATTTSDRVQVEHRDQRHGHEQELEPDATYEDIAIEKRVRGEIVVE